MSTNNSPIDAEQILNNATGPQSVSTDGLTVTARSTRDQLEALDVAAANRNATKKRRGLLFAKILPPSAIGCDRRG